MRKLPAASFDAAVTSPPYNIGLKYGKHDDAMTPREYLIWIEKVSAHIARLVRPGGSFFLNIAGTPSAPDLPFRAVLLIENFWKLQNTFHWIKAISIGEKSVGHFKPINSKRYVTNLHEYVFHFSHFNDAELDRLAVGVPYADKSNVKRWTHTGGRDLRCKGNVWFIPYDTIQKSRGHPSPFPVSLAEHCIRIAKAKKVLDPFVGGGSAALAAKRCGCVSFTGIDIDANYIKQARHAVKK